MKKQRRARVAVIPEGTRRGALVLVKHLDPGSLLASQRYLLRCDCGREIIQTHRRYKGAVNKTCGCGARGMERYRLQPGDEVGDFVVTEIVPNSLDVSSSQRHRTGRLRCVYCGKVVEDSLSAFPKSTAQFCDCQAFRPDTEARRAGYYRRRLPLKVISQGVPGSGTGKLTVVKPEIVPVEKEPETVNPWLTTEEAAGMLRLPVEVLLRWAEGNRYLPVIRLGDAGVFYDPDDVREFLRQAKKSPVSG